MALRQLVRRSLRGTGAAVFHYTGLRRAVAAAERRHSGGRRVLIVGYHRVVDDFEREAQRSAPASLISTQTFLRQLDAAAAAGYEFATMNDAVDVITRRRSAKKDLIVITFDDGYRDVYRHAYPILKSLGIPAILYLPAAMIGTARRYDHDQLFHVVSAASRSGREIDYPTLPAAAREVLEPVSRGRMTVSQSIDELIAIYPSTVLRQLIDALSDHFGMPLPDANAAEIMDWDEARRMAADGFQFGAHTLEHVVLTLEGPLRIEREILGSKRMIERELGAKVEHFSYCNGWYSDQIRRALIHYGFRSAVTTEALPNRVGTDPFALKRKMLWENFSVGPTGKYSTALTACHLDGVFGMLGIDRPVIGCCAQQIHVSVETSKLSPPGANETPIEHTHASLS